MILPTHLNCSFYGYNTRYEEADIILFGVPHYIHTYGIKPVITPTKYLRLISTFLEENSHLSKKIFYDTLQIHDAGDITTHTYENIEIDIRTLLEKINIDNKRFIMIGGSHEYTYYTLKYTKPDILVVLDAHLDLKNKFMNKKFTHATFIRRLIEKNYVNKVIFVGARAYEEEEIEIANERTDMVLWDERHKYKFLNLIGEENSIYLSIDLDHLDPSYMPHVSNPEPNGYSPKQTFDILIQISKSKNKIIGGDIMEYTPYTIDLHPGILASKIILELAVAIKLSHENYIYG